MQETSDAAIAALDGAHFDIPDPSAALECCIAPTQDGGIYYTGPTRRLLAAPAACGGPCPRASTEFNTWRELTTVYHEGVPGHHLQIAPGRLPRRASSTAGAA